MRTYFAKDEAEASKITRRVSGIAEFTVIIAPEKIDLFQKTESDYMSDKITQTDFYSILTSNDCLLSEDGEHYIQIDLKEFQAKLNADKSLFPESPGLRDQLLQIIENHFNGVKAS